MIVRLGGDGQRSSQVQAVEGAELVVSLGMDASRHRHDVHLLYLRTRVCLYATIRLVLDKRLDPS